MVAIPVGLTALWIVQQRNRKQQRDLAARLDEAETEIAENQPNFEALRKLIPKATEILEYIAVHAGHALTRWYDQIGQGPCDWDSLSVAERQRYEDFVEIAAAQLAVATIDFENLMASRGGELERSSALVEEMLTQSRKIITAYV